MMPRPTVPHEPVCASCHQNWPCPGSEEQRRWGLVLESIEKGRYDYFHDGMVWRVGPDDRVNLPVAEPDVRAALEAAGETFLSGLTPTGIARRYQVPDAHV